MGYHSIISCTLQQNTDCSLVSSGDQFCKNSELVDFFVYPVERKSEVGYHLTATSIQFLQYYRENFFYNISRSFRKILDPFLSTSEVHPLVEYNIYIGFTLNKVLNFMFNLCFNSLFLHHLSWLVWNVKVPDPGVFPVYRKHILLYRNVDQFPDRHRRLEHIVFCPKKNL